MPAVLLSLLFMPDMSEKKSPPQKEKSGLLRTPQAESKAFKRKLLSPEPAEDEDKKVTPKRKRPLGFDASSPDPGNSSSPRGGSGNVSRLSVPLSERQQMALLMRMTDESSQGDSSPKPSSPPPSVTSTKRSQADKKVNKRNERGETPLHLAAKRGDVKQTKKLIKAGASVNVTDYAGWTPLHEACNLGNVDVAKQLLKAGANVNVLGLGDESPLHDAAINNHSKLVTILLKHGANPLQPNVKGETPLDVANDINIKKLLGREIISSNSETSSVDEVRSPTSPESLASIKDEDRGIDVEDIKPRSSSMSMVRGDNSCNPGSIAGNRRMSLPPKSPVDKTLPSPRLFLKFKSAGSSSGEEAGSNQGLSSRKSTDSKEPMFKSYILTMDTGDQQQAPQQQQHLHPHSLHSQHRGERGSGRGSSRPSPACSPLPSMEVDHHQDTARDRDSTSSDHQHNQHHKHKVDPWDAVVGSASGGGSGGNVDGVSAGSGGQNSVSSLPPATPSSSSSLSSFSNVPSLKVQCVRPDSPQEDSVRGSSHTSSLQRLRTEPFTPHVIEEVSDDDGDEKGGSVFEDNVKNPRLYHTNMGGPPRLSPNMVGPGPHLGRNSQHIPAIDSVNHSTASTTTKHRTSHPPPSVVPQVSSSASTMDVTSVCMSRGSGVTSTTGSGAGSLTSAEKDASLPSSGASDRTSQLPPTFGNRRGSGGSGGGGGGSGGGSSSGSISCVNSTGAGPVSSGVAVTGNSVSVSLTNVSTSPSSSVAPSSQPQRWDSRPRTERSDRASPKALHSIDLFSMEKSDSSASSPLRMDIDENLSSSPRSDRDNDSRPSCPKVPPLKIILPSQKMSTTTHMPDQSKNSQAKPALPYVLNPTQTAAGGLGEWVPEMTDSNQGDKLPAPSTTVAMQEEDLLHVNTPSPSRPSRPSSRTSNRDENRNSTNRSSLESSPLVKEGAVSSGKEDEEGEGERQEDEDKGEESKPTRTLRSHTAMKQQQEQKQQKGGGSGKAESAKDSQDKASKADSKDFSDVRDDGDTTSEAGGVQQEDVPVHPRKRKLRPKTEAQSREQAEIVLEKPPNPYELYLNLRRQQIRNRHKMMCSVTPKLPTGFKDYLMVNCTYVLQGNTTSTLSVPMLTPPNSVTGPMRELFLEQEKARYRLRLQHHIEREKLMLAIEQEILREHARAARAVANQNQPLSVCTILCEEEIYNLQELDQGEDRDKSSRSRYNGRQFYSWLQDVGDKYDNIKTLLLLRHHHEAESLHAVQKMDWEWKLKECGQCDSKTTPVIDEVHLPMVQVNDEFELLPPQRLRPS